jgi:hypothetical protein
MDLHGWDVIEEEHAVLWREYQLSKGATSPCGRQEGFSLEAGRQVASPAGILRAHPVRAAGRAVEPALAGRARCSIEAVLERIDRGEAVGNRGEIVGLPRTRLTDRQENAFSSRRCVRGKTRVDGARE